MGKQKKDKGKKGGTSAAIPSLMEENFPILGGSGNTGACTRSNSTTTATITTTATNKLTHNTIDAACNSKLQTSGQEKAQSTSTADTSPVAFLTDTVWKKHSGVSVIVPDSADTSSRRLDAGNSSQKEASAGAAAVWCVHATKSAKLPVQVEKRKHKTVTVVRNISGDASVLLSSLKLALGTGGKLMTSAEESSSSVEIEIQGDHVNRVSSFVCAEHARISRTGGRQGVLKGVSKGELAAHSAAKSKNAPGAGAGGAPKSISKLDQKAAALQQQQKQKQSRGRK
jgi:translation initiation factor 1 (eIF-1/SUI1)